MIEATKQEVCRSENTASAVTRTAFAYFPLVLFGGVVVWLILGFPAVYATRAIVEPALVLIDRFGGPDLADISDAVQQLAMVFVGVVSVGISLVISAVSFYYSEGSS